MAVKGDRAVLEPQAIRLYADGHTLTSIGNQLGVSVNTLSSWKTDSKFPDRTMDEWDRARSQKRGNIQRLRDLFEDQLAHLENCSAEERTAQKMDALAKMGALLERWDKLEKAQRVADEVVSQVTKAGLTAETADDIRRQILGIGA